MKLFPEVTTSRDKFIKYIIITCESSNVEEEKLEEWVLHVSNEVHDAHYFYGMIFVEKPSFLLILHEFSHHLAQILRNITRNPLWDIDKVIDDITITIFR